MWSWRTWYTWPRRWRSNSKRKVRDRQLFGNQIIQGRKRTSGLIQRRKRIYGLIRRRRRNPWPIQGQKVSPLLLMTLCVIATLDVSDVKEEVTSQANAPTKELWCCERTVNMKPMNLKITQCRHWRMTKMKSSREKDHCWSQGEL